MIATSQEQSCYKPKNSISANGWAAMHDTSSDKEFIEALIEWTGKTASDIAKTAGLTPSTLTRPLNHPVKHRLSVPTLAKLKDTFPLFPGFADTPDLPVIRNDLDYVPITVMPSFAGMGGGGTGDDDPQMAQLPRRLIEDELRGKPHDFMLIDVRGDSMEPDFQHGDQILIDRRDRNPRQPGAFALWDGDGYVVKLVERIPQRSGWYKVFSANTRYTSYEIDSDDAEIIGRPVWFARRL